MFDNTGVLLNKKKKLGLSNIPQSGFGMSIVGDVNIGADIEI